MSTMNALVLGWIVAAVAGGWRYAPARRPLARRAPAPGPPRRNRAMAWGLVASAVVGLALAPPLGAVCAAVILVRPALARRRQLRRHRGAVVADLPELVDLVAIAAGAGLTVPQLVDAVAPRAPAVFADSFARVALDVARGVRYSDALSYRFPTEVGDAVRPLVAALVDHDRYGQPLVPALVGVAADVRRERRHAADLAARKLPVKLLFPLVLCILPAFGLFTIAPLLLSSLGRLSFST